MTTRLIANALATSAALVFTIGTAFSAPYQKGDKVAAFSARDQHGVEFTLAPAKTRYLLVSHDMETGKKANVALDALGKEYLGSKDAVYVANIHGMPGIGRAFAMPKMRKYAHRIILGDDAALMATFPEEKGSVTVLKLSNGKVAMVGYWNPGTEALDAMLK